MAFGAMREVAPMKPYDPSYAAFAAISWEQGA